MKALTVCQPFASLIMLPESDHRHKRVENRTWHCTHRGDLVIHAGKSREWLVDGGRGFDVEYGLEIAKLPFGMALGLVRVADCYSVNIGPDGNVFNQPDAYARFPWLRGHQHVDGPFCLILEEVRPFKRPFAWKGAQGLFPIPDRVVQEALDG